MIDKKRVDIAVEALLHASAAFFTFTKVETFGHRDDGITFIKRAVSQNRTGKETPLLIEESMINGIDVYRLWDAVDNLKENEEKAQFTFRVRNRWAGGAAAFTSIQDFSAGGKEDKSRPAPFVMESGEPDVLLGFDNAPNATEALLHALACCLNASFIYHAAAKNITVRELELNMEGDLDVRGFLGLDENIRNGYSQIRVNFRVKADASEEQVRELVELAQKRSPVFDIVTHETPVVANVEIVKSEQGERLRPNI